MTTTIRKKIEKKWRKRKIRRKKGRKGGHVVVGVGMAMRRVFSSTLPTPPTFNGTGFYFK